MGTLSDGLGLLFLGFAPGYQLNSLDQSPEAQPKKTT